MDLDTSFGRWLRARRRALDLTQDDLARRVGCSVVTIRKLEADERRPSRQIAERLADCLKIAPNQRAAIITLARAEPYFDPTPSEAAEAALRAPERPPTNLPTPLTRLIGRTQDLAALRNTLLRGEARLLTLLGAPGIGKIRLSIAVAHDVQAAFRDGAFFVALAPLADPALVLATIAQTLGVKEGAGQPLLETLTAALHAKRLLLVLDNFEHLLEAAPQVAALLEGCAGLKALVTSRTALHVRGERLYAVPPLLLPDLAQRPATTALARTPAVALLVERAQAVLPHFRLDEQNAAAVAAICVRLEGLPLAIELAATRIKLLPPEAVLARLEQRLGLLTDGAHDLPPRHRTLRAAIAWSYDLLDAGEQTLFARLGVFVGGCTLEAVAAVCNAEGDLPWEVVDGLAALLDQSLVQQEARPDGEPRFTMLETIREYALERQAESGQADATRRQHATYYLALAETAEREVHSPACGTWQERLAAEHDNLRAALYWAVEGGAVEISLQLAAALWYFWMNQGHVTEGRKWLAAALAPRKSPSVLRGGALNGAGYLASVQGDYAAANTLHEESLALYRELGDKQSIAWTLNHLGHAKMMQGDYSQATALHEESLALFQELGDNPGSTFLLIQLGESAYLQGEHERAVALIEQSLVHSRQHQDKMLLAWGLKLLGNLAQRQGDAGRAKVLLNESLALFKEIGNLTGVICYLEGMAEVATLQGQLARVVVLFGAAATLRTTLGTLPYPAEQAAYDRQLVAARERLGAEAFDAAWAEGRAMPLEQAIAEAFGTHP
jgi:predicted ATPase/DNA-binding XRE family transcriptional regulator